MENGAETKQAEVGQQGSGGNMKQEMDNILLTVKTVITDPVGFFRDMAKTGGFGQPLIFFAAMGLLAGIVHFVLSVLGLGIPMSFLRSLSMVIFFPIMCAIVGFLGAGIMFLIWKLMGSNESYETAYRCVAYAAVVMPIAQLLNVVPYIGSPAGMALSMFLFVLASIHVHNIKPKLAYIVFGVLFAISALSMMSAERAARRFANNMEDTFGNIEEMTPEDAGKAAAQFLKGFSKEAED